LQHRLQHGQPNEVPQPQSIQPSFNHASLKLAPLQIERALHAKHPDCVCLCPRRPVGRGAVSGDAVRADQTPSMITLTAGGCGPGFHRGPNGGCRVNGGGAYVHPYAHPYGGRHCWWRHGVRVCN
jgi:hypothetical protein